MDHIDQIEDYISGNLTSDQITAFEKAMSLNPVLKKEVNLQRQLQEHFRDEGRRRLLSVIEEVVQEPSSSKPKEDRRRPPKFPWLKWFGLVLILSAATWFIWRQPVVEQDPAPFKHEGRFPPPPVPKSIPEDEVPAKPGELRADIPKEVEKNEGLLAEANPRDFVINSSMESLMTGMRGDEVDIQLESPKFTEKGFKSRKGKTTITFSGITTGLFDDGLTLQIFSNQDINRPILTYPIEISGTVEDNSDFNSTFKLKLNPGLYYFSILTSSDESEVYVGKFLIDKP